MANVQAGFPVANLGIGGTWTPGSATSGGGGGSGASLKKFYKNVRPNVSMAGTYWDNPEQVAGMTGLFGDVLSEGLGNYGSFLQNPAAHPLFQGQLQGLLQSLMPSEDRARGSLTDMFRAAGGLRSGAYGSAATNLEGELMNQRFQAASKLLGQSFNPIMEAILQPLMQLAPMLGALKQNQSASIGWPSPPGAGPAARPPIGGGGRVSIGGGTGISSLQGWTPGNITNPGGDWDFLPGGIGSSGYTGQFIDVGGFPAGTPDYYNEAPGGDFGWSEGDWGY